MSSSAHGISVTLGRICCCNGNTAHAVAYDIDGDGSPEVLIFNRSLEEMDTLFVLKWRDGGLRLISPVRHDRLGLDPPHLPVVGSAFSTSSSVQVVDFDGNGQMEVLVNGDYDEYWNENGDRAWRPIAPPRLFAMKNGQFELREAFAPGTSPMQLRARAVAGVIVPSIIPYSALSQRSCDVRLVLEGPPLPRPGEPIVLSGGSDLRLVKVWEGPYDVDTARLVGTTDGCVSFDAEYRGESNDLFPLLRDKARRAFLRYPDQQIVRASVHLIGHQVGGIPVELFLHVDVERDGSERAPQ